MGRPNRCGVGAHFPGSYEYRVLRWSESRGEWFTVAYTEFLDVALDHAKDGDRVEECAWREVAIS